MTRTPTNSSPRPIWQRAIRKPPPLSLTDYEKTGRARSRSAEGACLPRRRNLAIPRKQPPLWTASIISDPDETKGFTAISANCGSRSNNYKGAIRELLPRVVAMHPLDKASAQFDLAQAYFAAGQKGKAEENVLAALEAAPDYRPAQKLLFQLEDSEKGK